MNLQESREFIIDELTKEQDPLLTGIVKLILENRETLLKDPLFERKMEIIQYVMYCDDPEILAQLENVLKK